jgi:hypothetical protein
MTRLCSFTVIAMRLISAEEAISLKKDKHSLRVDCFAITRNDIVESTNYLTKPITAL